ncbi:relaxase/mobilization nuclease domain-containing protein [Thalassospira marina]|uniref:Relaxase n=1 Tax=Thalassospira marina TaxID=2048283 RepID=A0A2N3KD75_9PROT|nr:relaxase/mobilization nuclease domain-containing protein [Thalassospira marina]PKR48446.1 relaxase [Thalassospira marina]
MRFKIPKQQPESFRASALYLAGLVKGLSPDRVEFVERRNLHTDNPRAAAAVMDATAAQSKRCKQPAYHFIITFDPKDAAAGKVTPEVKRKVAQQVIERMGLSEHQLMVYSHKDTDHPHMHFLVNRIHPAMHVAYDRHQDGRRLTGIVHELAREHGLNILRNREYERQLGRDMEEQGLQPTDADYWQARRDGRETRSRFGEEEVSHLREVLYADFRGAENWADLSQRLAAKGITMERKGQGLILTDGEREAKLSDMGKGVRFRTLEERFGEGFDDYMARRTTEIARTDRQPDERIDTRDLDDAERRTVEGFMAEEPEASPGEAAVRRFDDADMDYRYWGQVEASYRTAAGKVRYAERQQTFQEKQEGRDRSWLEKRSRSLDDILAKVYRDGAKARTIWDALEDKHGILDAERMVQEDPFILGAVRGVRMGESRSAARKEAKRYYRYLAERRRKWRDAVNRLGHTQYQIEQARRRVAQAVRDFELLRQIAGTPETLRATMLEKIRQRARALSHVTERAIRQANLSDERRKQLHRAWRTAQERKLERERKRERGRAIGLDLGTFDD